MSQWVCRCVECDERWCQACEAECPVCLVGAGVETSIRTCAQCRYVFCQLCEDGWECPDCLKMMCRDCWDRGMDCPCRSEPLNETDELARDLPPGFSLVPETEFEDYSARDPKGWRKWWGRKLKPKPWKEAQ